MLQWQSERLQTRIIAVKSKKAKVKPCFGNKFAIFISKYMKWPINIFQKKHALFFFQIKRRILGLLVNYLHMILTYFITVIYNMNLIDLHVNDFTLLN